MSHTIRRIFGQMAARYPRPGAYLNEISNMDTIDMLFDSCRNQRTSDVIPRGLSPSRASVTSSSIVTANNSINQHTLQNNNATAPAFTQRAVSTVTTRLPQNLIQGSAYIQGNEQGPGGRVTNPSMIRVQTPVNIQRMGIPPGGNQR